MALTTYSELKTAIKTRLSRSDLDALIPDFITIAEAKFNRNLRLHSMEVEATLSASTEFIPLPDNYLQMRNFQINTSPVRSLEYMTPQVMDVRYGGIVGEPKFYTEIANQLQIAPKPNGTYTFDMTYYQKITPMSDAATNWLFQNAPDVYIYGACIEAAIQIQDDQMLQRFETQLNQSVADLVRADDRAVASGSALTMRST